MCDVQYLSKDETVKLYEKTCEISMGHTLASYSGNIAILIFSLCMQKTPTKQKNYCAVSLPLITNDSVKKKGSLDENTCLPRSLFHLHNTERNGLQYSP